MGTTLLYTIGHSDRELDELTRRLGDADVGVLIDVRAHPRSRRHPQFNFDALHAGAERCGIAYQWAGRALGGRREPRPGSPHTALGDEGFRGYADHMDSDEFRAAASWLIDLAAKVPLAIMCAEREPERCHRSMIADYLTLQGLTVVHLVSAGEAREHRVSSLVRSVSAHPIYDRRVSGSLDLR